MSRQQFTSRNDKGQIFTFQKSGSTASFDPAIGFSSGSKRVSWRIDNGSNITQTAGNSITYTGFTSDTGIRTIEMRGNSFKNINLINFNTDNLYGQLDLTPLLDIETEFIVFNNPNLTGITHSPSAKSIELYIAQLCNLTGNLDLTPLSGLNTTFWVGSNANLTGITHSPSSVSFTRYDANNCNLTGNLDLTPLSGLGGVFRVYNNTNLTGITHSVSSQNFTSYFANNCNLTGNLDLSPLTKLGGSSSGLSFSVVSTYLNPNLSGITLPNSTQFFKNNANTEIGGTFSLHSCNLDYVDFTPLSGATFLTGTTQGNPRISLRDNGMSTTHVNHILVDFSGNTTYNPTGWSNINLNISGTNGAPDSSSGGYDGISARNFLTGSPYNWTITHT